MKNILYVSNACSTQEYDRLFAGMDLKTNQQSQKFNRLFAEGMAANGRSVTVLSSRPVNTSLHPKKWYAKKTESVGGVHYVYLSFFNFKYVRQALIRIGLVREVKKWIKSNPDGLIFCDILNYSLFAALSGVKRKNAKLIGIVTDLPEILGGGKLEGRGVRQTALIAECDGLVLLAEPMNGKINTKHRPFVVMEGFCDVHMREKDNTLCGKYDKKVVLYAGLLHKKYGIKNLTEAFIQADIPDSELHIYGTGDYENELKKITAEHKNVRYFGTKDNAYVVREQLKATLLVNPRPTDEAFVHYSFPSKNMEYIASGTPMLTTALPSMPEEYRAHCFVSDGFDVQSLCRELKIILSKPKEELYAIGAQAKEWALRTKNNAVQAEKVLDFFDC